MELLIATRNPGKVKEILEVFQEWEGKHRFLIPSDLGIEEDFPEEGETFSDNALGKARFYFERSGLFSLADDSGILVNALQGELGVKTRRWGPGASATDEEWMDAFLARMASENDRSARFVCAAACVGPNGLELFTEADTEGLLEQELKTPIQAGIPLSSLFVPEGCQNVYAQLAVEEKNAISHRGKAFKELKNLLTPYLC